MASDRARRREARARPWGPAGRWRRAGGALLAAALVGVSAAGGWLPARAAGPDGEVDRPDATAARVRPDPTAVAGAEPAAPPARDRLDEDAAGAVASVLDELAAALSDADEAALVPLLAEPDGEVGRRWRRRAANLGEVPLERLRLRLDRRVGVMTTDRVRARYEGDEDAEEVVVVGVVEEHVMADQDLDGPARHRHTLTFVRDGTRWRLAEDRDGRILGRPEPGFLWDLVPVASTRRGPVLVLHPRGADDADRLAAEAVTALDVLPARWPGEWSQRVTLVVPDDHEQLSHVVGGSLQLDDFLAFTSATARSAPGVHELTGTRLIVNPGRFPSGAAARRRVLLHELVHVATRPVASMRLPMWLEEGIAQALGENGPSTRHTRHLDVAGPVGRRLPTGPEFSAGSRQDTFLAYQRAYSFLDHLVTRSGRDAVVDFYTAVGRSATRPGTLGHRLDAAAERELGADLDTLVAGWRSAG